MPHFNSSEISSMISSKKCKVKKSTTGRQNARIDDELLLSVLADTQRCWIRNSNRPSSQDFLKFQSSSPSAKCVDKITLQKKIYNMNKSAFFGSKDLLFEELDLKFICKHKNNLKFDETKSKYTFTLLCWIPPP